MPRMAMSIAFIVNAIVIWHCWTTGLTIFLNNLTQALEALSKSVLGKWNCWCESHQTLQHPVWSKVGVNMPLSTNYFLPSWLQWNLCNPGFSPGFFREAHSLEGVESTACPLITAPKERSQFFRHIRIQEWEIERLGSGDYAFDVAFS